ncbi:MAG: eIF2A-related protein [Thiohalospira sp.]
MDFKKQNILIVIDQFEELFRYKSGRKGQLAYNESEAFVKLLITAHQTTNLPVYIVLTMRSDFIGECSQFHELTELINDSNYLVPQMTRDDFRKAIEGPVAVGGAKIESQLVQQLLNEVSDNPDQLPILQHALMRTWNYWMEHSDPGLPITISDYEAIGKMEKALSEHANEAFDELKEDEKWICESMFKTITEKGNDNRGIRHPTSVKDIASIAKVTPNEVVKVVEPFRDPGRSFLTPSYEIELDENSIIDLSHESLMRIWNKLKIWVDEEWNAVQMYLRLSEAAEMYQLGNTGLWRPPDLQLALNWREKQNPTLDWAKRYNPAFERTMVYLNTSDKEYKAEEENKVKLQKRQLRRSKIFAIVLGTAAIISLGLTIYSQDLVVRVEREKAEAEKQRGIAIEQQQIAEEKTIFAQEKEKEALEEKEEAEKQRQIAVTKEMEALRNFEIAEQQKQIALRREQEANQQRSLAEKNEDEAQRQTLEAEKARQEALSRRMLSIAQSMAVKSQQISDNIQLKVLVAYQAYLFNKKYDGPTHNPDVYLGLYYALKGIKGQTYNALNGHTGSVMDIAFIPQTNKMFTTGGDGKILQWDISNLDKSYTSIIENPYGKRSLAISADGKRLICATDDSKILVFNLSNSVELNKELSGHESIVSTIEIAPNNQFFLSASNDKTIRKWDFNSLNSEVFLESESKINSLAISPDSKKVAVGTQDGKVTIFNIQNANDTEIIISELKSAVTAVKYNKTGKWLVAGNTKGDIVVWDTNTYMQIDNLEGHKSRIYDIDFNPENNMMATSSLDGTVRIWDCMNLNNQPIELRDHESWVLSIAFSPDGNNLVTSSNQKERLLIWPAKADLIAPEVKNSIVRNFTTDEWEAFVAKDINYEKTVPEIDNP